MTERNERVLVVDSDAGTAREAKKTLEDGGYDVSISDGTSAAAERAGRFDCVVTEADLPDRDGLTFAADLEADHPAVAVVVHTDAGSEAVASRAFTVGVDEYVPKSDGSEALVAAVDRVTARVPDDGDRSRSADRYRTIVENVGDLIYTLDADGRLTYVNDAFTAYTQRDRSDLVGSHISTVIPTEAYETGTRLVRALLETDETNIGRYEFAAERASGDRIYLENHMSLLHDDDGRFDGTVGIVRDVTERRVQAEALKRQNEQLDEFASIVSHDLRNPLSVIKGKAELLRQTGDVEHVDGLLANVDRMDALLTDLLALAREGRMVESLERLPLERAVIDAWQHVDTGEATLEFDENLGTVEADRSRLEQLLENLFRNAVEHGVDGPDGRGGDPGDGTAALTVRVERTPDGFAVRDDGRGIDPAIRDEVFDRGVTTDDGTGFGLSIVRRIAEAHGWSIAVDPASDDGARFVVST